MAEKFEPGEWPRDPHGYVFLGRAFDQVGAAMFMADWTNREQHISCPVQLTEGGMPQRHSTDDLLARDILHNHAPEFKARLSSLAGKQRAAAAIMARNASRSISNSSRSFSRERSPPSEDEVANAKRTLQLTDALTSDEWQAARELNKRAFEAATPLWDRGVAVREAMIRGLERGNLEAVIREKAGGAMMPMPAGWWNADIADVRFVRGDIDPVNPFSATSNHASWIFIRQSSLEAALTALSRARPPREVSLASVETNCRKWLEAELTSDATKNWNKAKFKENAGKKFDIGTRAFIRAWDAAITNTGTVSRKRAGAKPKS